MNNPNETLRVFIRSHQDSVIRKQRQSTLADVSSALSELSDILETADSFAENQTVRGIALLCRLVSGLGQGIATLLGEDNVYGASALLRQLVEIEYLAFVGFQDPQRIGDWHASDQETLRKGFTPQKMRAESGGLFADQEYWLHCQIGGHPNPKAWMLFHETNGANQICFIAPDSVHHLRRLWTSMRLLLERLELPLPELQTLIARGARAVAAWESVEDSEILQYDGIQSPSLCDAQDA